jgi:competence protein ComEC
LTAVSGQNVALCVAAAGPLLRRARPFTRWVLTLWLIGWFVVLTRAEPSVLRAGVMAALGATAYALGRPREPIRLLAMAVIGLVLVDPLLVWSVGFWLSVGATFGVTAIGPWFVGRLGRLGPLALPVGITLGAQIGVALPSILVFGRLSLVGTVANLVAVPVAGFVMLVGLPACLLAGAVPAVGGIVMAPSGWAAAWVDAVATVGAAVEPAAPWSWLGWSLLVAAVGWVVHRPASVPGAKPAGAPPDPSARLQP